jgi:phosphoribosylanthranilate isomerase
MLIKICGITTPEDADLSVRLGANALGFNFWLGSPRFAGNAEWIRSYETSALKVGVFVDEHPDSVRAAMERHRLDIAQIHRGEAPEDLRYWLVRSVDENFRVSQLHHGPAAWLLDAPATNMPGGTGRTFDWARARSNEHPVIIAGGLDAANVVEAITIAQPWGIDSCSRLEATPGHKDPTKLAAFIEAALERVQV